MTENKVEIFKNEQFGEIRTVIIDNEPWFVAADVCRALEIDSTATRRLDDDEKSALRLTQTSSNGVEQEREMTVINEPGLYSLVLGSRKSEAKEFKRWVTHEVIPSIRKHGAYMTEDTIKKVLTTPDFIIQLATELKEEQERSAALRKENQIMKPKAEYFDCLVDRNLLTNFRDTAKELHVKQNEFITYLLELGYVYRDKKKKLLPYAQYVNEGLFELKEYSNKQTGQCGNQTLITPKGRETFRLLLKAKRKVENYA